MALRKIKTTVGILAVAVNIGWLFLWDSPQIGTLERNLDAARLLNVNPCSVMLEAHLQPLQKQWYEDSVPILHDLVVVEDFYYAIFNVDGQVGNGKAGRYQV